MKLTLLGTSDFRADSPLGTAGYIVETPQTMLKLDFGRGNIMRMAQAGIDWRKMNAILISHNHPDHIGDFFQYLQVFTLFRDQRKLDHDIPLFGPKGFVDYFDHFRRTIVTPWTHIPHTQELIEETTRIGDCMVTALPMKHTAPTSGYRIEHDDRVICYTGDTELNDNLFVLAKNADILLTECALRNGDSPVNGHMRPTDIARVARECGVRQVVLTHYPAEPAERTFRVKEIQAEFSGTVTAGDDLMTFEI